MGLHRSLPAPPPGDSHDGRVPGNRTARQGQLSAPASAPLNIRHIVSTRDRVGSAFTVPPSVPSPGQPTPPSERLAEGRRGVLRVFPRRTSMTPSDEMVFVGHPPLWRPEADEVHISVAFSWDRERGRELRDAWAQHYARVVLGGPAFDGEGGGFTPGMYLRQGVTITSRGCIHRCPWCIVDSPIRLLDIKAGHIVQDNNLLATGRQHLRKVFEMLRCQRSPVVFSGGLEAALVTDEVAENLRSLRIGQLFLAADTDESLPALERALLRLSFLPRDKLRCYVLVGFGGESLETGEARCRRVWELGGLPFAQLFQPIRGFIQYPTEWKQRIRAWQRPAATKALMRDAHA